jgi:ribosomal protein L24E
MLAKETLCPYCGKENSETNGPKCYFCKMVLTDKYLMYIDSDNRIYNLCSTTCLDLLEESINEDNEEDFEEDSPHFLGNICPMCGLENSNHPSEAKALCKLCGMSIDRESSQYIIRGKSVYLYFCCARCLKLYNVSHQMDFDKIHTEN